MTSIHPEPKFDYNDYLLLPEDKRYELIDGELYMVPAPSPYHQAIAGRIEAKLRIFVAERGLGEVLGAPCDVYFSHYDVVQPDILYIRSKRVGIIKENCVEGPPDLVVEILSPSSRDRDLEMKRKLYSRHGVREYWIVDPDGKTVQVLTREKASLATAVTYSEEEEFHSPLLGDFRMKLAEIFKPIGS